MSSIRDNLRVGDCAFLGVNTMDGASQKDEFALIYFPPLLEKTAATITNIGAGSNGDVAYSSSLPVGEYLTSAYMTSDKPAGHVSFHLKIPDASSASSYFSGGVQYISSMKLASQDQLIIHQDQTYLCAFDTTGQWESGAFTATASTSALPTGLTNGDTAITVPSGKANWMYNGVRKNAQQHSCKSGTPASQPSHFRPPSHRSHRPERGSFRAVCRLSSAAPPPSCVRPSTIPITG